MAAAASARPPFAVAFAVLYALTGVAFAALLGRTLLAHPLLPFRLDDVAWCADWLLTTVRRQPALPAALRAPPSFFGSCPTADVSRGRRAAVAGAATRSWAC